MLPAHVVITPPDTVLVSIDFVIPHLEAVRKNDSGCWILDTGLLVWFFHGIPADRDRVAKDSLKKFRKTSLLVSF